MIDKTVLYFNVDKNNSNQKADDLDAHPSPQRNDPGNGIVADSEPENKNGTGAIKDDGKVVDNVKEICSLVFLIFYLQLKPGEFITKLLGSDFYAN